MIPVCEPLVAEKEKSLVLDCLNTGWISSTGKYITQFEKAWSEYCGMRHGIAVSSGTAALQIAVQLLALKPGDEVIMPTFTIISCAQAITACDAVPVLIDSDLKTWQMDVSQIEAKISPRTRAIMAVHIYGHPLDMDPLIEIAHRNGLPIIEDAAEVHGAEYKGRKCGGMGDISVFSFYANKLITTGEGGMVLTQSDNFAEKARALRNLCFQGSRRFLHRQLGYNFRLTNIHAAIGVAQLKRIDQILARKREIAQLYSQQLQDLAGIKLPIEESWAKNVYWVYGILVDGETGMNAARVGKKLARLNIETRPFFLGMHEQPVFRAMGLFIDESYPVAEKLARQGLYLPSGLSIENSEINQVCTAVKECFA